MICIYTVHAKVAKMLSEAIAIIIMKVDAGMEIENLNGKWSLTHTITLL